MSAAIKGENRNPAGRPRGRPDRRHIYKQLEPHVPAILDTMAALAKDGDTAAARLLLDRSVPVLRAGDVAKTYPIEGNTPTERANSIVLAVREGRISPTEAITLMGLIGSAAAIQTNTELLARLENLERRLAERIVGEQP